MQLSMFESNENDIKETLLNVLKENKRDTDYVSIKENQNSHSVFFFDSKVFEIKKTNSSFKLLFPLKEISLLNFLEDRLTENKTNLIFEINAPNDLYILKDFILSKYDHFDKITLGKGFGCCSRYVQCSDNLACIVDDKFRRRQCAYNVNLLKGRIIYGVNRNVD